MEENSKEKNALIFSYLHLRKTIGYLGFFLPFVLYTGAKLFFHTGLESSLSSYYHTGVGGVFVGTLWVIGFFLFSYEGYDCVDNIVANYGCFFAIGMALFPTLATDSVSTAAVFAGYVHLAFAALFFLTLIYFSLFLFTKTKDDEPAEGKKLLRNRVYKFCGYFMFACIVLMALFFLLPEDVRNGYKGLHPIFWLETIAIMLFGISWLTKGDALKILVDKPESS